MPEQSLVTAVIPVHNHENWCVGALKSVASQTHRPLRIVVVDDGSTDRSLPNLLASLSELSDGGGDNPHSWLGRMDGVGVMVLSFPTARGPAFARNVGMKAGWEGTDYFAFLDSDDLYEPGKVSLSLDAFDGDERVGVVYSDYDTLRPDGLRLRQHKEPYSRMRLLAECLVNCDSLVRKKAVEDCGGFDEQLRVAEDYDLWLRISERFLLAHLPRSLLTIRVGKHSSTDVIGKERWLACHRRVFEKLQERQKSAS